MKILADSFLLGVTVAALAAGCASRTDTTPVATTTTTLPTQSGGQVVISSTGPSAAVRGEVRHHVVGKVTDIDRNDGTVKFKTPDGAKAEIRVPPVAASSLRDGDQVTVDVVITPRP